MSAKEAFLRLLPELVEQQMPAVAKALAVVQRESPVATRAAPYGLTVVAAAAAVVVTGSPFR
jgi:hypothetical protein